ncbi:MAG: TldD/PmbA family protein [Gemmatimonadota bacterium]
MALLTRDEAERLLKKVLAYSRAEACEANLNGGDTGNIRYARNAVSTSGTTSDLQLVVQSNFGKRSGVATINEFDDASIEKAVRRSEELARLAPENPEFVPVLGPQRYLESTTWFDSTAKIDADYRARAAAASILPAREKGLTAAGFFTHNAGFQAMANTASLFAYQQVTGVDFSVTMRTEDGTGSGYVTRNYNDVSRLDVGAASAIAMEKAIASTNPKAIEPGKYTVVLEPTAVADLVGLMMFSMDARQADEGRSFLAKPGGGTRLGEKLVDERITIYSDPTHPDVPAVPWSQDGRPQERVVWIEKGVVKNLYYSRYWAEKKGVKAIPAPNNGIIEGTNDSLEDLIRGTERGILVTRFWYIRPVDPQTLLYTGLTRDGTFYIENGRIKHAIKNFRFNESPVIMLNNLDALGKPVRAGGSEVGGGTLVPPMRIRDFTFSSLSDAV